MDPVSAIGFAASIITFIDFSYKLVTGTLEIKDSGTTSENAHTTSILDSLDKVTNALGQDIKGSSDYEIELRALSNKCKEVSKELRVELAKLATTPNSKLKAIKKVLRVMWKRGDINNLKKRLDEYRNQSFSCLTAILNQRQIQTSLQIEKLGQQIGTHSSTLTKKVEEIQINLSKSFQDGLDMSDTTIKKALENSIQAILDPNARPSPEVRVLRQLYFPSMFLREDNIHEAEAGTFDWILKDENSFGDEEPFQDHTNNNSSQLESPNNSHHGSNLGPDFDLGLDRKDEREYRGQIKSSRKKQLQARSKLIRWLSTEDGIFHVSGKAGSGKSTLMKLIASNSRTEEELQAWAGAQSELIFVQFFAWRSGDNMQQSLHGLYRSILFSVLLHHPELIRLAFPGIFGTFSNSDKRCEEYIDAPYFLLTRLRQGLDNLFQNLSSGCTTKKMSICLLVDGLDEFKNKDEGEEQTYKSLVQTLDLWTQNKNVKFLVSSRPKKEFENIPNLRSRIHLHELNMPDILKFARSRFEKSEILVRNNVQDYYLKLVNRIVTDAKGVFMWVVLVIIKLCDMIKDGEDEDFLYKFLGGELKLKDLYKKLLESIDHDDLKMFFYRMIFLVLRCQGGCPILAMAWLDHIFDPDYPTTLPPNLSTETEKVELARRRVAATKGLLEVTGDGSALQDVVTSPIAIVDFIHRTAYDYFKDSQEIRDMSTQFPDLTEDTIRVKVECANMLSLTGVKGFTDKAIMLLMGSIGALGSVDNRFRLLVTTEKVAHFCLQSPRYPAIGQLSAGLARLYSTLVYENGPGFSHLHFAAYMGLSGSFEYISQKLEQLPEAMHTDGTFSLLVSSIIGDNTYYPVDSPLIDYLLQRGVSPCEEVQVMKHCRPWCSKKDYKISAWVVLCCCFALHFMSNRPLQRILNHIESFLKTGAVDLNVFLILQIRPEYLTEVSEQPQNKPQGCVFLVLKDLVEFLDCGILERSEELLRKSQEKCGKRRYFRELNNNPDITVQENQFYNSMGKLWNWFQDLWKYVVLAGIWAIMILTGLSLEYPKHREDMAKEERSKSENQSPDYANIIFSAESISSLNPQYIDPRSTNREGLHYTHFLQAVLVGERLYWLSKRNSVRVY